MLMSDNTDVRYPYEGVLFSSIFINGNNRGGGGGGADHNGAIFTREALFRKYLNPTQPPFKIISV